MKIIPRADQWQFIGDVYQAWNQGAQNVVGIASTGFGKCLGRGTPVLMFDGTVRPVETIRAGEVLMGPDSTPRRVLSTCSGREALYRVIPNKGDPYVVNESHILSLKMTQTGAVVNLSVREYLRRNATFRHCAKGWRVGVDFPAQAPLPLDPYFLGLWLGDGTQRTVALTTGDPETIEFARNFFASHGQGMRIEPNSARSVVVHAVGTPGRTNPIRRALVGMGLARCKFVPNIFRTANRADRLQILAGLVDSDGHFAAQGAYEITQKNDILANDILFLARSVGLAAYLTRVKKTCGNNGKVGFYSRVTISGHLDSIPVRVARKKAPPRRQKKDVLRVGIRVEPIGEGEYFGFEIDGDRLFLLGDFTVTHNTVCLARIVEQHDGASCVIAHRQELVGQISLMLARYGVRHNVVASESTRKAIAAAHVAELGACYLTPSARVAVASVDTLVRAQGLEQWAQTVTLWIVDEGHHLVLDNKWHRAIGLFSNPHCRGLLPTATPIRADGKGLGTPELGGSGVAHAMVSAPPMRWLIEQGFLTPYRVICVESDLRLLESQVSASGDWSTAKLKEASKKSRIVGDVVREYLRWAPGKRHITFATDTETAANMTAAYRVAGVRAECLTGKTHDHVRRDIIKRFERGDLEEIVAVDIISEGFDLPAIEAVSFARPSMSLGVVWQQFGRALRPMPGKTEALIIDHVGNVLNPAIGLPDRPRVWSLANRDKRRGAASDGIPMRVCVACFEPYERIYRDCPHCGHYQEPESRGSPEQVEGDLAEMSPELLAKLRGEVEQATLSVEWERARIAATGLPHVPTMGLVKHHAERLETLGSLAAVMADWGGRRRAEGLTDSQMQRLFFLRFGIDVFSAQALKRAEAQSLIDRVVNSN